MQPTVPPTTPPSSARTVHWQQQWCKSATQAHIVRHQWAPTFVMEMECGRRWFGLVAAPLSFRSPYLRSCVIIIVFGVRVCRAWLLCAACRCNINIKYYPGICCHRAIFCENEFKMVRFSAFVFFLYAECVVCSVNDATRPSLFRFVCVYIRPFHHVDTKHTDIQLAYLKK